VKNAKASLPSAPKLPSENVSAATKSTVRHVADYVKEEKNPTKNGSQWSMVRAFLFITCFCCIIFCFFLLRQSDFLHRSITIHTRLNFGFASIVLVIFEAAHIFSSTFGYRVFQLRAAGDSYVQFLSSCILFRLRT